MLDTKYLDSLPTRLERCNIPHPKGYGYCEAKKGKHPEGKHFYKSNGGDFIKWAIVNLPQNGVDAINIAIKQLKSTYQTLDSYIPGNWKDTNQYDSLVVKKAELLRTIHQLEEFKKL